MKDRNKIITQILLVAEDYGFEIININFRNINELKDKVKLTFEYEYNQFILIYSYEKNDIYKINSFASYFRNELDKRLKEGK